MIIDDAIREYWQFVIVAVYFIISGWIVAGLNIHFILSGFLWIALLLSTYWLYEKAEDSRKG